MCDQRKVVNIIKQNEDNDKFLEFLKEKTQCLKINKRSDTYTHMDNYRIVFKTIEEARKFVNDGSFAYKNEDIYPIASSPIDNGFIDIFSKYRK
jgi:hypothetical protein